MDAEFIKILERHKCRTEPFAVATVVAVSGSSSARVGAKAIFDELGHNVHGWVGGGCAEKFVGEQVLTAIVEGRPRIVTARLDDEVFGLGVACGGQMDVFIDPIVPAEVLVVPNLGGFESDFNELARRLEISIAWLARGHHQPPPPDRFETALLIFAQTLATARHRSGQSLRLVRDLPVRFEAALSKIPRSVLILGNSRISETLAILLAKSGFQVRVIGPDVKSEDYPDQVQCSCLHTNFGSINFSSNEAVVVASQLPVDFNLAANALAAGSPYVSMVGSRTRVMDLYRHLDQLNDHPVAVPLYAPAGLDIDAKGPGEIALSIAAELISLSNF